MQARALKCTVKGRVQGVSYRAKTSERATKLGIDGWVRNLDDGSVELIVSGEAASVDSLIAWLWEGPSDARVSDVAVEEWQGEVEPGFRVVY